MGPSNSLVKKSRVGESRDRPEILPSSGLSKGLWMGHSSAGAPETCGTLKLPSVWVSISLRINLSHHRVAGPSSGLSANPDVKTSRRVYFVCDAKGSFSVVFAERLRTVTKGPLRGSKVRLSPNFVAAHTTNRSLPCPQSRRNFPFWNKCRSHGRIVVRLS